MSNNRAIAVFVKTPGLSPIKTRLAKGIGQDKAMEFYELSLACVSELINSVDATPFWAVAEEDSKRFNNFKNMRTGHRGLGERQHHIYSALLENFDRVMLLSADAPQLTPYLLNGSFNKLDKYDFVIGPSHDGGYNFFAGKKEVPFDIWTRVKYSLPSTCENLLTHLSDFYTMNPFTDVDHAKDLRTMIDEMPNTPSKTQKEIIAWSNEILKYYIPI